MSRVSDDTEKFNWKHTAVFRSQYGGIQFHLGSVSVYWLTSMSGQRPNQSINQSIKYL